MLINIRLKCPNCGRRVADYIGNKKAVTVLVEECDVDLDALKVKCNLCKSQVMILIRNHEVYEISKRQII